MGSWLLIIIIIEDIITAVKEPPKIIALKQSYVFINIICANAHPQNA